MEGGGNGDGAAVRHPHGREKGASALDEGGADREHEVFSKSQS